MSGSDMGSSFLEWNCGAHVVGAGAAFVGAENVRSDGEYLGPTSSSNLHTLFLFIADQYTLFVRESRNHKRAIL